MENYSALYDAQQGIGFTGCLVCKPEVGALGLFWARIGTETPLGVGGIEGKNRECWDSRQGSGLGGMGGMEDGVTQPSRALWCGGEMAVTTEITYS